MWRLFDTEPPTAQAVFKNGVRDASWLSASMIFCLVSLHAGDNSSKWSCRLRVGGRWVSGGNRCRHLPNSPAVEAALTRRDHGAVFGDVFSTHGSSTSWGRTDIVGGLTVQRADFLLAGRRRQGVHVVHQTLLWGQENVAGTVFPQPPPPTHTHSPKTCRSARPDSKSPPGPPSWSFRGARSRRFLLHTSSRP